jgi:hypothetical protein
LLTKEVGTDMWKASGEFGVGIRPKRNSQLKVNATKNLENDSTFG